jgi:hypothetical protein
MIDYILADAHISRIVFWVMCVGCGIALSTIFSAVRGR